MITEDLVYKNLNETGPGISRRIAAEMVFTADLSNAGAVTLADLRTTIQLGGMYTSKEGSKALGSKALQETLESEQEVMNSAVESTIRRSTSFNLPHPAIKEGTSFWKSPTSPS